MSRIEKLIKEKCPNGVEFRKLEECCNILDKKRKPVAKSVREAGEYPYYGANGIQDYVSDYIFDGTFVLVGEDGSVITPNGTPVVTWAEGKIWVNNHAHIIEAIDSVDLRYIYHFLQTVYVGDLIHGNIPKLNQGDFRHIEIAVPPIEVQQEIVRVLDKFIEVEAELQAELDARKKQYDEYLNLLMDFSNDDTIKYMSVGELFEIKNGLNKEKEAFGKGKPIINFIDVFKKRYLTNGNFSGLVDVDKEEIERYSAKKGDVFFTRTSETREDIGMSSTLIEDVEGCVFSGFVLRARPLTNLLLPKFCSYYFSTNHARRTIMKYASFTTRATTTGPKLSKIMVPILPISEQQQIVDILDRMDAICNDYGKGIPAEIKARHKQYEYYRDKLLTFERRVV